MIGEPTGGIIEDEVPKPESRGDDLVRPQEESVLPAGESQDSEVRQSAPEEETPIPSSDNPLKTKSETALPYEAKKPSYESRKAEIEARCSDRITTLAGILSELVKDDKKGEDLLEMLSKNAGYPNQSIKIPASSKQWDEFRDAILTKWTQIEKERDTEIGKLNDEQHADIIGKIEKV